MKKNNQTSSIKDLLEKSVFGSIATKNKINSVIKHSTIFSFWDSIVGPKFSRHTKPFAIKGNKIYVSAKSPVIIQELNLYKSKLLNKINSYSTPLGIEIKDMIFNYKNFVASNPITISNKEDIQNKITNEEINSITIDNKTQTELKEKINKLNFLNSQQKETLLNKLINAKKAKVIQEKNKN